MRILITGASGFIGSHLGLALSGFHNILGVTWRCPNPPPFSCVSQDLTKDKESVELLWSFRPQVILHAAALSRVLSCEEHPALARRTNVDTTRYLAEWAAAHAARLIFLSSDQVFSGERGAYVESDAAAPINEYGKSKLEAETIVLGVSSKSLVVRCNSVIGTSRGWGESFSDRVLLALREGTTLTLFHDQYRSPIHVRSLIRVLRGICESPDITGILHVGGPDRLNRAETAAIVAHAHGLDVRSLESGSYRSHPRWRIMPQDTSYGLGRMKQMDDSIVPRSITEDFADDAKEEESRL